MRNDQSPVVTFANMRAGDTREFNKTENDGEILGFPPGKVISSVLDLFMIPKEVQEKVKEPVDNISDHIQNVLEDAKSKLSGWVLKAVFGPGYVLYLVACVCSWVLFFVLVGDIGWSFWRKREFPPTKWASRVAAPVAIFCLLIANLVTTVMEAIAKLLNIVAGIFKVTVHPGAGFIGISWASFIIMIVIAFGLRGIHLPTARLSPLPNSKNLSKRYPSFLGKLPYFHKKAKGNTDGQEEYEMSYPEDRTTRDSRAAEVSRHH